MAPGGGGTRARTSRTEPGRTRRQRGRGKPGTLTRQPGGHCLVVTDDQGRGHLEHLTPVRPKPRRHPSSRNVGQRARASPSNEPEGTTRYRRGQSRADQATPPPKVQSATVGTQPGWAGRHSARVAHSAGPAGGIAIKASGSVGPRPARDVRAEVDTMALSRCCGSKIETWNDNTKHCSECGGKLG